MGKDTNALSKTNTNPRRKDPMNSDRDEERDAEESEEESEEDIRDLLIDHRFEDLRDILSEQPELIEELFSSITSIADEGDTVAMSFLSEFLSEKELLSFAILNRDVLDWFLGQREGNVYSLFDENPILEDHMNGYANDDFESSENLIDYLLDMEALTEDERDELVSRFDNQ